MAPPAPLTARHPGRAIIHADLDAFYARAYGLTRDELRYILDPADVAGADYPTETFRVLKASEQRQFGEYRTRRLVQVFQREVDRGRLPGAVLMLGRRGRVVQVTLNANFLSSFSRPERSRPAAVSAVSSRSSSSSRR